MDIHEHDEESYIEYEHYEEIETMKKEPADPIPENHYERFRHRLYEMSGKWSDRNRMLFILGVATGYRMQDLVDLTIADLQYFLEKKEFIIQEKKQHNTWKAYMIKHPDSKQKIPPKRKFPISSTLEKELKKYIKNKKKSEYAFPSQKGNGSKFISQKSFSAILTKVAEDKEINLSNLTISGHSLRKTFAQRVWDATKDLNKVRVALGHRYLETTIRYLGLNEEIIRNASKITGKKL